MNRSALFFSAALFCIIGGIFKYSYSKTLSSKDTVKLLDEYRERNVIGCAPFSENSFYDNQPPTIPLLEGWSNYSIRIRTKSDSTQIYFDQGINMFYGFHRTEAIASFRKALFFDSTNAACYLGLVLCWAPNINFVPYRQNPTIFTFLNKAKEYSADAGEFEKLLIDAQLSRFSLDTSISRQKLNEQYAVAMKRMYQQFPGNADVGAFYADALMQLHPWDLYDKNGDARPWTREIESLLEELLKKYPDHPGLNHYYVHCVEASNTPQRGLNSARKLEILTPGMSHMVHMASHIYLRTGYYKEGVQSNEKAITAYDDYKKLFPPVERGAGFYYDHALSMEFANALMLPKYSSAIQIANTKRSSMGSRIKDGLTPGNGDQYNYSLAVLAWIRYGKWDSILKEPTLNNEWVYARFLQDFGKGIAYARNGELADAQKQLQSMQELINYAGLMNHGPLENAPFAGCQVAEYTLKGIIAEEQKNFEKAINNLEKAVQLEDSMIYNEPKDWLLPARAYLGNALLKAKQFAKAETVFKKDLTIYPENVWSLYGVYLALKGQHNSSGSTSVYKRLKRVQAGSDIKLNGAVF